MIDPLGNFRRIMNSGAGETFTQTTDSLEAIRDFLAAFVGMNQGLAYRGVVDAVPGANQFTITSLAGLGAGKFADVTAPYRAFVMTDAGGASAAPQGEMQAITAYVTATGVFTTAAFTAAVAAGDEIIIIHPRLAEVLDLLGYHNVPAADAVTNTRMRDVAGNKTDTVQYDRTSVTASHLRFLRANLSQTQELLVPNERLLETWQDEAGISELLWLLTHPATGAPWSRGVGGLGVSLRATSVPNASENCRLVGRRRWQASNYGLNTRLKALIFEFGLRLTTIANIDNATTIFGLTSGQADLRTTQNLIGFALVGDALQTVTDNAGAETVNTGFGETLTNLNKLRIIVLNGVAYFYLNEVLIATHNANVPSAPLYPDWYMATEAGGAATLEVMPIHVRESVLTGMIAYANP